MAAKTKSVGGKEYGAKSFAYVGDPNNPDTWHLLIADKDHVADALSRYDQADIPAAAKARVARKLVAAAKKFGIDASGFAQQYLKTSEADMSTDDIRQELQEELGEEFGSDSYGTPMYVIDQVFQDYLIARGPDQKMYRIAYSMDGAGEATLGEPQEVEMAYMAVSQEAQICASEGAAEDGWTWPVQIIEAGPATGVIRGQAIPHVFTPQVVAEFAAATNGARFGRRHPAPTENADDPGRIAGWFSDGRTEGAAARASLHLFRTEGDMRQRFMDAREAKQMQLFNLSVLALVAFKPSVVGGKQVMESVKLGRLVSVDLVTEAGAGGKFLPVAASANILKEISALQLGAVKTGGAQGAANEKGAAMKERIMRVIEALRKHDAGRATELVTEMAAVKEEGYPEFLTRVTEGALAAAEKVAGNAQTAQATQELVTEARTLLDESKRLHSKNRVEALLSASKLPQPAMTLVREHLADKIMDDAAIDTEIKKVREAFAAFSKVGRINGSRVEGGMDSEDKVQLAFDGLLGVREPGQKAYVEAFARKGVSKTLPTGTVAPFRGVREAYITITGDSGLRFGDDGVGGFLHISESPALTSNFPNLLLNSMTKKLLQDYAELGFGGLDQVVTFTDINDFKTQDRVRMGYLSELATVAENGTYVDFSIPSDERVHYVATKRGNTLPVTRETILNDDLNKIAAFPSRIARAGHRTLKKFITNFMVNNPNYDVDSLSWFNASHNNLGATSLSIPSLIAAEILLFSQTEQNSAELLGLTLDWLMVNINNKAVAYQINSAQFYNPGPAIQQPNPFWKRFGDAGERIIVNEMFGSDHSWCYGTMPSNAPILEIGFVQGQREPQIFLQNDPTTGAVFSNDVITYKVRHEYGGDMTDFRGIGKNVVA